MWLSTSKKRIIQRFREGRPRQFRFQLRDFGRVHLREADLSDIAQGAAEAAYTKAIHFAAPFFTLRNGLAYSRRSVVALRIEARSPGMISARVSSRTVSFG